ncbi:MAG TPA: DUF3108 domain-containing protein [Xanthobacteraceae bacterium]|nr:DUF3108 domain-containing protein [Xanthobacteraceae bacterium]
MILDGSASRIDKTKDMKIVVSFRLAVRRMLLGVGGVVAFMLGGASWDSARAQGKLEARYVASVGGIPLGKGAWVIEIGDTQYTAAASGRVTGVLRAVTSGEGSSAVRGLLNGGHPVPQNYAVHVTSDDKTDEVRMTFNSGTVKELVAEPPFAPTPDRIPVTEIHRKGVIDPMSAGLMPVGGTGDVLVPEACQRTLPIFDGRQRFDLTLTFKRLDKVSSDKGYQGPVVVCQVTYQPLAGHRPSRYAIKYLMEQRDMEIWLAPIAGTRILVPYRIQVPTLLGAAVLEATQFVAVAQPARPTSTNAKTQ